MLLIPEASHETHEAVHGRIWQHVSCSNTPYRTKGFVLVAALAASASAGSFLACFPAWHISVVSHHLLQRPVCNGQHLFMQEQVLLTYIQRIYHPFLLRAPKEVQRHGDIATVLFLRMLDTNESILGCAVLMKSLDQLHSALEILEHTVLTSGTRPCSCCESKSRQMSTMVQSHLTWWRHVHAACILHPYKSRRDGHPE